MPIVKNTHAARVQGRTHRPQAASIRPSIKAAMAKLKVIERPTYPKYKNGGWKASPGSCRSGFKSCPSKGGVASRKNGLDVNRMKAKNATPIAACTERTRARKVGGRFPPNHAAIAPNSETMSTHSSIEPS